MVVLALAVPEASPRRLGGSTILPYIDTVTTVVIERLRWNNVECISFNITFQPWLSGSVAQSVVPIHQGCGFDGQGTYKNRPVNAKISGTTSGCLSVCHSLSLSQINKGKNLTSVFDFCNLWGKRVTQTAGCELFPPGPRSSQWDHYCCSGTSLLWNKFARSVAVTHSSGKTHLPEARVEKEGYYMFSLCYFYPSGF